MTVEKTLWDKSPAGEDIYKYKMKNSSGAYVELGSVGAAIVGIYVPDKSGKMTNIVLSYPDAKSYFGDGPCAGKCPGRFANRIAKGHFTLDGKEFSLPVNNGPNHLHGGPDGFQNKVWESRIVGDAVEFMYFSEDGEAGYPGNLKVVAHYEWSEQNELRLSFTAECDAPTVLNMTNHVYFNLKGEGSVLDHELKLNASEYLPTDENLVPVGDSEPVAGTALDFTNPKTLGRDIKDEKCLALKYGKGYDLCYVIDGATPGQIQEAAELYSPQTGRKLDIFTSQPGVQIYTGNWLEGCPDGEGGRKYHDYDAVAIECQHYPDSPNHSDYPETVLRPGEVFEESVIWVFSVK